MFLSENLVNTQNFLFGQTPLVQDVDITSGQIPEEFMQQGYCLLDNLRDAEECVQYLYQFTEGVKKNNHPFSYLFNGPISLAKADQIPVCDEAEHTPCQALHFDMGMPLMAHPSEPQMMTLLIGLFLPSDSRPSKAVTRILPLSGLLRGRDLSQSERLLKQYLIESGDGPDHYNGYRLQLFARVLDALAGHSELADTRDQSMAEWFINKNDREGINSIKNENDFYKLYNLDLEKLEQHITIQPGQMLLIDNSRVVHGRFGQRSYAEIYQFMMGTQDCPGNKVERYRKNLVDYLGG